MLGFCPAGGKAVRPQDNKIMMLTNQEEEDAAGNTAEGVEAKVKRKPELPSQSEVEAHYAANHVPYRDWCPHCVMGRAPNAPHRKVNKKERDGVVTVAMDYAFLVEGKDKEDQEDPGQSALNL